MTSMFDQFEQASSRTKNNDSNAAALSNLGFINMKLEPDVPIFSKSKKDFTPPDKISHVCISNKQLVLAMVNGILFRMDMHNPKQQQEISLTQYTLTNRLTNLFLDPTGSHLLMTFASKTTEGNAEMIYLSKNSTKLKTTAKFRSHEFTEVAWNQLNESEITTGPILIGTSKGLIFETEIVLEGDKFFTSSLEQYWRQVFDIGKGSNTPITGLEYFKYPNSDKYAIFATTPTRLYHFVGHSESDDKALLQVFNKYLNIPEVDTFIEKESSLRYSKLEFFSSNLTTPNSFAWVTGEGITYCEMDETFFDSSSIKSRTKLITYPKPLYQDYRVATKNPIAIALTEFHIILAYTDSIRAICILNEQVVYEDNFNEAFGKLIVITKDRRTGEIWVITENSIFCLRIVKEERNNWKIYCDNQKFDLAKKYASNNEVYFNQVLIKEAEMLFDQKQYNLSAERFAETQNSFEEVCLKFIQINESKALQIFLINKLGTLKPTDKTQITMIVIWLIELYLKRLEEKRLKNLSESSDYFLIQKDFENFLTIEIVTECIRSNKSTIYELMASHGDKTNVIKLTEDNKDFEQLIRIHLHKNNYHKALEVLKSQKNSELYYQFAPILMQEIPKFLVKVLMEMERKLVPIRLLPALVGCNSEMHAREVIRYLEFCVDKLRNSDKAIHNLLVSLYAKYDEKKLREYLKVQGPDQKEVSYDVYFALRLCQEHNLKEASVEVSAILGLWEIAVDLAISFDLTLAKKIANMSPEEDSELRKKLWLKIAKSVVSGKDDIEEAVKFLSQCDLIKIEDILPFFSDFVTIDHFKEAICNSLKDYNEHIQNLKEEMEEATKSAEEVREDIQTFRNRYTFIKCIATCELCNITLMSKAFYVFPCGHQFHSDCLILELSISLSPSKKDRLSDLKRQLRLLNNQSNVDNLSTESGGLSRKDILKAEIDNIVASECLFCGENMIRNIDKPFIEDSEYENIMKDWE